MHSLKVWISCLISPSLLAVYAVDLTWRLYESPNCCHSSDSHVTNRDLSGKNYYFFFNKVCLDQIAIPKGVELKNRMNDSPTALGFNEEQWTQRVPWAPHLCILSLGPLAFSFRSYSHCQRLQNMTKEDNFGDQAEQTICCFTKQSPLPRVQRTTKWQKAGSFHRMNDRKQGSTCRAELAWCLVKQRVYRAVKVSLQLTDVVRWAGVAPSGA